MVYDSFNIMRQQSTPPGVGLTNNPINEGLTLEDSPYDFPQDKLGMITPGWELMVKARTEDLWMRVVGEEPGGYICQVVPVPTDTRIHGLKQGDLVFVRPRNIQAASQGTATFERRGKGFEQTQTTVRPVPGGGAVSYSRSNLFVDY